jgi:hypothetical protein
VFGPLARAALELSADDRERLIALLIAMRPT